MVARERPDSAGAGRGVVEVGVSLTGLGAKVVGPAGAVRWTRGGAGRGPDGGCEQQTEAGPAVATGAGGCLSRRRRPGRLLPADAVLRDAADRAVAGLGPAGRECVGVGGHDVGGR